MGRILAPVWLDKRWPASYDAKENCISVFLLLLTDEDQYTRLPGNPAMATLALWWWMLGSRIPGLRSHQHTGYDDWRVADLYHVHTYGIRRTGCLRT